MRYGIWIEKPGHWTGWYSWMLDDKQWPMTFDEAEIDHRVDLVRKSHPAGTIVEARPDPPDVMPWNEAEWRKATA